MKTKSPSAAELIRTGNPAGKETSVQIIHQLIIPETPTGLIGEKVVYNEKYLSKCKNGIAAVPLPECGYFTITKATLLDNGGVMVQLRPYPHGYFRFQDDTHIGISNMKKFKQ